MAVLRYQYQASTWWTTPSRPGILIEVAKEWSSAVPGKQREVQEILEQIVAQVRIEPTWELGRIAQEMASYMQMIGGGLLWLRCTEGPTAVTVYLSDT